METSENRSTKGKDPALKNAELKKGGLAQNDAGLKEPAPQKTDAQIQEEKASLRRRMRTALKALSPGERTLLDRKLARNVLSFLELSGADIIYAYASLPWEPGTWDLLQSFLERGIRVALPRVEGEGMAFYEIHSLSDLTEGAMHLMEPALQTVQARDVNAPMLVPGMAFTENGGRLGKGGGFYDKFLAAEPNHPAIALAYEFQLVPHLALNAHDRQMEHIITEKRCINCLPRLL